MGWDRIMSDFEPQCHVFRTKQLRKPRPCHLCHQAVIKQASCCRGESIKSRPQQQQQQQEHHCLAVTLKSPPR
ncbi:hypothetical protein M0804_003546 [Polistes exclamans]|nr:hypothetical protein M0804_003546 [Polistes exclamans]